MTDNREQRTKGRGQRPEDGQQKSARRRRSSVLRRLVKWSLLILAGFLVLILLLWAGLQTQWAKQQLERLVASATAKTGDYRVAIEGLDGRLPFSITLKEATVSDAKGPWLKLEQFDFSMKPFDLISGLIHVNRLRMGHLTVSRLPESPKNPSKPKEAPTEKTSFALPHILAQEIRLQRIDVGEALAGRPMSFALNSRIKTTENNIQATASLKDLNSADNAFTLKANYDLKTENLSADLAYHESAVGLVAGLVGLKDLDGIQLTATAKGPFSHIKGQLNLNMDGYGKTALKYDVKNQAAVALQLKGQITAENRILPPQVAQVMTSETSDLSLNASLSPEKEVQLTGLSIKNGPAVISLKGTANLEKENMDMVAEVQGFDLAPFLKGTGVSLKDPGPVHISAVGPFTAPEVTVTTALAGLNAQETTLTDTTLTVRALFEKNFTGLKRTAVALGSQKVKIQQAPKLQGPLKVNIEAQSPDFSTWQVKALNMTLPGVVVSVKNALMNPMEERFAGDLTIHVDRIAPLLPPDTPPIDGRFSMNARIKCAGPADATAQLNMTVSQLSGLPPEASALAGPKVTLKARTKMKKDRVTLKSLALKGSQTEISANGWVNLKENIFDVAYRMSLDNAGHAVSKPENLPVGDVRSEGKISGKFDDFSARATLESRSLRVKGLEIKNLKTKLKAEGLPLKPSGNIHLNASAMDQPLQLNSDFAWSGKTLKVGDAKVQIPGIDLAASLNLTPETQYFSGKVKGEITSLEMVKALTGVAAKGTGTFQLLAGETDTKSGAPAITLDGDFKDLKYQNYGASTFNIHAKVDDINKLQGSASLNATDMPLGSSHLQTLKLAARGGLSNADITLEVEGATQMNIQDQANSGTASGVPLFLSTKIAVKRTDLWHLRLDTLKAGYESLKVNLQKPATLTYGKNGQINLDDLQLKTDKGRLQASARMDQNTVLAKVRITDLPLSLLEPFVGQDLDGSAAISLDLSGPLNDPGVSATVNVNKYKIMDRDGSKPILVNVKLHSRRDGERLLADLELSGLGKTPFKADGSIPAHISLKPFAFDVEKDGTLQGTLQGKFDLAILQNLPGMDDQSLQGKVDIDMGIGGSLEKWALNGGVTISKGRFENVDQGVLLNDIEGRFDAEGRILKLTRLTATDGSTGTISLKGQTDADSPFQTEMALILRQATLLRKEMLTVTAGGKLKVKGNKDRMDLTGEIDLDRTEIAIPKRFPPDVTVIPVTTINDPAAVASERSASKKGTTPIKLNLTVNIPDKFFVRGRGLDAEFKGRLTVTGPADNPVVRGSLNVVRGTFLCLSRTFKVTSGQISFDGATPPVPFLNINTQVNAGEITAQVDVSGPADAFKLKLSSQPTLPQDEIMAQILFGQSVAKLNTFQALQLAYSVNELAGGYGPDVVGKTRGFLGLDRLDFSGGDENEKSKTDGGNDSTGPSVTLGKYVTDRVYVGVEQDLTDSKQDVIVEVNITPNLTVESKAGTRSGAGLGFNWNYDY